MHNLTTLELEKQLVELEHAEKGLLDVLNRKKRHSYWGWALLLLGIFLLASDAAEMGFFAIVLAIGGLLIGNRYYLKQDLDENRDAQKEIRLELLERAYAS